MTTREEDQKSPQVDRKAEDELPNFNPFQTFIFQNVDKHMSPEELRNNLCFDDNRRPYISVHMPCDKSGNTTGVAVVSAPKTCSRHILSCHGEYSNLFATTRRRLNVKLNVKQHNDTVLNVLKASKWIKNDMGGIFSRMVSAETLRITPAREITLQQCLVDSGAYFTHLRFASKKDVGDVIERAFLSGVEKMVIKTYNVRHAQKAQKLAADYPGILYFTAGVDSFELKSWKGETTLACLRELLADPQCVAMGEIGLNGKKTESLKAQTDMFTAQISLACDLGKPILIEEDGSMTDAILEIFSRFSPLPPVCINTNNLMRESVEKYHEKGFYLAISGYLWIDVPPGWLDDWIVNLIQDADNARILLASNSPNSYPYFISKFKDSARTYLRVVHRLACMNLSEYNCALIRKYCCQRNESLCLQSVNELVSGNSQTTSAKMAGLTRKNAYKFFKFTQQDRKLSVISQKKMTLTEEEVAVDNTELDISSGLFFFIAILPVLVIVACEVITDISCY